MPQQPEIGGAHALLSLGTKDGKAEPRDEKEKNTKNTRHRTENGDKNKAESQSNAKDNDKDNDKGNAKDNDKDKYDVKDDFEKDLNGDTSEINGINSGTDGKANGSLRSDYKDKIAFDEKDRYENLDFMDKANQQLNDAVEAAVMRYVGGTLDSNDDLHGNTLPHNADAHNESHDADAHDTQKRRLHHDDLMSEYQWDKFLEEEVATGFERPSPRKRRRKSFGAGHEIDPDLAELDSTSEHDQLVHAAIMGAGELAKQLSLPPQTRIPPHYLPERRADDHDASAINHLAHAASALSRPKSSAPPGLRIRRQLKKGSESPVETFRSKYNHSSLDLLVESASNESCMWFNSQGDLRSGKPRPFSPEEIDIAENFVQGYCQLHNMSRLDICRRVWTSERPKDQFWESLTKAFPYRSRASVYKHIRRQYHIFDVRAKWTAEEDALLRRLCETSATNWKKIGETMNRMPEDCRDRWRNYIKCGENRSKNKWSEEEEQSLRNIVMEMLTAQEQSNAPMSINWTTVSEKMNGVRSRIQCRYKWNKLLRRESLSKVASMDNSVKLWVLNRLAESNVSDFDSVDWDYIAHLYHELHKGKDKALWTGSDFKVLFEKLRREIRDHKNLPLQTITTKLLNQLYEEENSLGPTKSSDVKPLAYEELRPKPVHDPNTDEAANVANAAVAAVSSSVNEQDAQHQEYSLWR